MDNETPSTADVGAPRGVWRAVSPRFGAFPDWSAARNPKHWPASLAILLAIGLVGSLVLLLVSILAARSGYVSTLEADLRELSFVEQLTLVVLLAPLFEELIFRLPLMARPRLGVLAAAGAVGVVYFLSGDGPAVAITALCALVVLACTTLWIQSLVVETERDSAKGEAGQRSPTWRDSFAGWWTEHPRWPIWCSIVAFGAVHIANFEVTWTLLTVLVAPLIVSPQIWLGLMFTIARVRYGWWAGSLLHALHNLVIWSTIEVLRLTT